MSLITGVGCLPRKSDVGQLCAVASSKLATISPNEWDDILKTMDGGCVDLSAYVGEIYYQNGHGSCAHESWNKAIEIVYRMAGFEVPTFNPWFSYGIAVNWRGGPRVGTSIDENLTLLRKVGVCPANVWSREQGPNKKPSAEAYAAAEKYKPLEALDCENIADVGTALLRRHPVVIGWSGHSEVLVGLLPGKRVRVCGSYGSKYYKGSGFHDEPISNVDFRYGAIILRTVTDLGLTP